MSFTPTLGERDPSSLGLMRRAYTFPLGIPEYSREAWEDLTSGRWGNVIAWLIIAPTLCSALLMIRLIWLYRPAKPA